MELILHRPTLPDDRSFHGSIFPYDDKFICIYHNSEEHNIGSCFLDSNFIHIPNTHTKDIRDSCTKDICGFKNIDSRIVKYNNQYYISTSKILNGPEYIQLFKLVITDKINIDKSFCISFLSINNFPNYSRRREKNWCPWEFQGKLYYTYSLNPHKILEVNLETKEVSLIYETNWYNNSLWFTEIWTDPFFRLNCPPILLPDSTYLGIFHTMRISSLKTNYHKIQPNNLLSYWTGFYRFENKPPFKIISISSEPFICPDYQLSENWPFHPPPSGGNPFYPFYMFLKDNELFLTGGSNEIAVAYCKFNINDILHTLIPVYNSDMTPNARCHQDFFTFLSLNGEKNGTFLDIGCSDPIISNNTYGLEKIGWTGICIDSSIEYKIFFTEHRSSQYILYEGQDEDQDFNIINNFFNKYPVIDYLSFNHSFMMNQILFKIPFDKIKFKVITIKHDCYAIGNELKESITKLLKEHNYFLLCDNIKIFYLEKESEFEDWWVNPDLVDMSLISKYQSSGKRWNQVLYGS